MFTLKTLRSIGFALLAVAALGFTPAQTHAGSMDVSGGTFSGLSNHVTEGSISIVKTGSGYELVFADNFSLDGAPDPVVGLGSNGKYEPATEVSKLKNKTGAQSYKLPASFKPGEHSEVYVWCKDVGVPLGVATLKKSS